MVEAESKEATGTNPNTFFRLQQIPPFINNSKEPLKFLPSQKKIYEIDFATEKGKSYTITPF